MRSRSFAGAECRKRLLEYLVIQTISGQGGNLKEFNIGVQLYGRDPATYDPRIDPAVRVDIGRLRTKLKEYYETEGCADTLRIMLPKGSYGVLFEERDSNAPASAPNGSAQPLTPPSLDLRPPEDIRLPSPTKPASKPYLYAAVLVVLLATAWAIYWRSHPASAAIAAARPDITLAKRKSPDPEAYNLLLKARARHAEGTREAFDQAVIYLNQAIRRDPTYADAYAALASAYASAAVNFAAAPLDFAQNAKAAAEAALQLDPSSAQAYAALGLVDSTVLLNWSGGEQELRKAIRISPQNIAAHNALRVALLAQGRFKEAMAEARTTANLEPLSATGVGVGLVRYMARDYDGSLADFTKARDLHPEVIATHLFVGMAWEAKDEFEKAMAEYRLCLPQIPETKANIAHLLARMGKRTEARKMLVEIEREPSGRVFNAFDIACAYAALDDREQAFKWLERAYADRAIWALKVHPMLDSLRADRRFTQLLKKTGLAG